MEELEQQERPGVFTRLFGIFSRKDDREENEIDQENEEEQEGGRQKALLRRRVETRYRIVVRRQVTTFDDAYAAATGLKRGDQQVLNLTMCDVSLRSKITDFLCGVNFAVEGKWEELGEHVYLIAPSDATVEVAPPTPRMAATKN
jgi:cell division inhibitor SepF